MDKESTMSKDWVRCQSKKRPNHFYIFNKQTGETRWCTESSGVKTETTCSVKRIMKTPAQDRLKRLQTNLEKAKPKESGSVKAKDVRQNKKLDISAKQLQDSRKETLFSKEASSPNRKKIPRGEQVTEEVAKESKSQYNLHKDFPALCKDQTSTVPTETNKFRIPKITSNQSKSTSDKKSEKLKQSEDVEITFNSVTMEKIPILEKQLQDANSPKKNETTNEISTNLKTIPPGKKSEKTIQCDNNNKQELSKDEKPSVMSVLKDYCSTLYKKVVPSNKRNHTESEKYLSDQSKPIFKRQRLDSNKVILKGALQENHSREQETKKLYTSNTPLSTPLLLTGNANDRLQRLRKSLLIQQTSLKPTQPLSPLSPSSHESKLSSSICSSSASLPESEPMDWQPIYEEFSANRNTYVVSDSKSDNGSTCSEHFDTVNENLLRLSADKKQNKHWKTNYFYFVVDTNVFLENITFVDELTNMKLCDTEGTLIYVPYCVLQELDKLKIRSPSESIKTRATRAIKFLNNALEKKAQHIKAQSAADENKRLIKITSPDDSILNCCLQAKENIENVLLLTEDINLRNKAISSDILVSTKSDLISKHESQI